jgi:hypothetical protein
MNVWSYTSIPPIVFVIWYLIQHRVKLDMTQPCKFWFTEVYIVSMCLKFFYVIFTAYEIWYLFLKRVWIFAQTIFVSKHNKTSTQQIELCDWKTYICRKR